MSFSQTGEGIPLEACFEVSLAPPERTLAWLIKNADLTGLGAYVERKERLQSELSEGELLNLASRRALLNKDPVVIEDALAQLRLKGPPGSKSQWWALEGFTQVDMLIETEYLLLAIEAKRTESGPQTATTYFTRDQVVRNLECLQQYARGKPYFVLLATDDEKAGQYLLTEATLKASLPYFEDQERIDLASHFLGSLTWSDLAVGLGVKPQWPDTVRAALEIFEHH